MNSLQRVRLILCRPKIAANIGACARLATNYDLSDLILVQPQCDWRSDEAQKLATGPARERLFQVRICHSLSEALSDCGSVIGFTRRPSTQNISMLPLSELKPFTVSAKLTTALLFGNEETGLSYEDLIPTSHICTIPTSAALPSLNLSHAVAIALSHIFGEEPLSQADIANGHPQDKQSHPATFDEWNRLMTTWEEVLKLAGMTHSRNPERILTQVRRVILRAEPTSQELGLFQAMVSKLRLVLSQNANLDVRERGEKSRDAPSEKLLN